MTHAYYQSMARRLSRHSSMQSSGGSGKDDNAKEQQAIRLLMPARLFLLHLSLYCLFSSANAKQAGYNKIAAG